MILDINYLKEMSDLLFKMDIKEYPILISKDDFVNFTNELIPYILSGKVTTACHDRYFTLGVIRYNAINFLFLTVIKNKY